MSAPRAIRSCIAFWLVALVLAALLIVAVEAGAAVLRALGVF
jgi:hypothetical protein